MRVEESVPEAILCCGADGVIAGWSTGAQLLFDRSDAEAIGRPFTSLLLPTRPGEVATVLERIQLGQSIEPFDAVLVRRDAKPIEVSVAASPILDTSGRVITIAWIARGAQRGPAERAVVALRQVSATLGHDLQGSLRRVVGFATLVSLRCREELDDEGQQLLDCTLQCARELQDQIEQLRALARGALPQADGGGALKTQPNFQP
ncbi:MAG TPA: PAS domain-containing protein [Candidatus Polarisedimenticolaceae bacterium]|nr:PAS domain-containing protein [Candidatus Polarisedimenticolaceae bacterium]